MNDQQRDTPPQGEGRIEPCLRNSPKRARRSRRRWSLFLVLFSLIGMVSLWWLFNRSIDSLTGLGMPRAAFLQGSAGCGLRYISLGLAVLLPGFLFSNILTWVIRPARLALDQEARGFAAADFRQSCRRLIQASLAAMAICYPLALSGGMQHFRLAPDGIYYRGWFSLRLQRYGWEQVREIRASCSRRAYRSWVNEGYFKLLMDDGTAIDLVAGWPRNFFRAYPALSQTLKDIPVAFHFEPVAAARGVRSCSKQWLPYFSQKPGGK